MRRNVWIVVIGVIVTVVIQICLRSYQKPIKPVETFDQSVQKRIENHLGKISEKTLKESLAMLVKMEFYTGQVALLVMVGYFRSTRSRVIRKIFIRWIPY
jgi:uncharacterized protein YpmB